MLMTREAPVPARTHVGPGRQGGGQRLGAYAAYAPSCARRWPKSAVRGAPCAATGEGEHAWTQQQRPCEQEEPPQGQTSAPSQAEAAAPQLEQGAMMHADAASARAWIAAWRATQAAPPQPAPQPFPAPSPRPPSSPRAFSNTLRFWVPDAVLPRFRAALSAREAEMRGAPGFLGLWVTHLRQEGWQGPHIIQVVSKWASIPDWEAWSLGLGHRNHHPLPAGVMQFVARKGEGFAEDYVPFKDLADQVPNAKY